MPIIEDLSRICYHGSGLRDTMTGGFCGLLSAYSVVGRWRGEYWI